MLPRMGADCQSGNARSVRARRGRGGPKQKQRVLQAEPLR